MKITPFTLVFYHNSSIYYFNTWTGCDFFYDKTSFVIYYKSNPLYIPCLPITVLEKIDLSEYKFNIRLNKGNSLYFFLHESLTLQESKNKLCDTLTISVKGPSCGAGTYIMSLKFTTGTPQRIGMRYKYYIADVHPTGSAGIYFYKSDIEYTELYNGEKTAKLLNGIYEKKITINVSTPRTAISTGEPILEIPITSDLGSDADTIIISLNFETGVLAARGEILLSDS